MTVKISHSFFAILFVLVTLVCKAPIDVNSHDQNKDGKKDNILYTKSDSKISIFMETFEFQKETPDDWTWLRMDSKDPKSFQIFYNEIASKDPKKIDIKIWFGPDNVKLIEKNDKDLDGYFENTKYYNKFAKPKITSGIIARIEIDSDQDHKVEIWIYPMKRLEVDMNGDGIPDKMSTEAKVISETLKNYKSLAQIKGLMELSRNQSWALHPELIQDETLKAIIPYSF
ncbi:Lsa25.6 family adhesin [Leptospira kmetyi]|uniref:Lsa25.6 family adhesin n=1 Tax=Leptospira kmetyi TaxID=408139 RepID=UPI003EC0504B